MLALVFFVPGCTLHGSVTPSAHIRPPGEPKSCYQRVQSSRNPQEAAGLERLVYHGLAWWEAWVRPKLMGLAAGNGRYRMINRPKPCYGW